MQIVVHLPRAGSPEGEPPTRRALLEAVATAVGRLVDTAYADDADPAWGAAIRRYEDGWIRKVVRRARGIHWRRVQDLPGVGVEHDGAGVRALLPGPVGELPDVVRKLQVGGTEAEPDDDGGGPPPPGALAVAVNPAVTMTAGKAAAQAGHAAQLAWHAMPPARRREWAVAGCPVRVVRVTEGEWRAGLDHAAVVVRDGGLTEVTPGTTTALAWW
ncbi:hypothetical protein DY240_15860 [Jiangella rhizosphaerae]|uniref:peptidyl-tRNA hydrolase n=2 Tax=Jiangella rhizosphaerae TaxID=2293569 RepID=A0A418KPS5_9ACTN|nr:hypothetical protein DY240_15860 [Jiangella rhizosphaerae]